LKEDDNDDDDDSGTVPVYLFRTDVFKRQQNFMLTKLTATAFLRLDILKFVVHDALPCFNDKM
jgi:hypothetical protein